MLGALLGSTVVLGLLSGVLRGPCLALQSADLGQLAGSGCFSDLQVMWFDRGLSEHRFPYLQPVTDPVTGQLSTPEYPVLSGLLMWLLSLPVRTYAGFVWAATLVMTAAAAGITAILYRLSGRSAWLWAAAPALVFYLAYNLDALPALCSVAAIALVMRSDPVRVAPARYLWAAALLGIGGGLKLYPLVLVPALCLWLLFGSPGPGQAPPADRLRRALLAAGVSLAVFTAANLPFALANTDGWLAPFRFQATRDLGVSTLSVWFLVGGRFPGATQSGLMAAATVATGLGIAAAYLSAWLVARSAARFPLAGAAVAALAAYLVLNKVFSPQYVIWLLPFLVLVGFRVVVVAAYVLLDVVMYVALNLADGALARSDGAGADLWLAILFISVVLRFGYVIAVGVLAPRRGG